MLKYFCLLSILSLLHLVAPGQSPGGFTPGYQRPAIPDAPQPGSLTPRSLADPPNSAPGTGQRYLNPLLQPHPVPPAHSSPALSGHSTESNYIDPFEPRCDQNRISALKSTLRDLYHEERRISHELYARTSGTTHYRNAFGEISEMLNQTAPCNLKRAVFLVENAWGDNNATYNDFCKSIDSMASDCRYLIAQAENRDNQTLNLAVFAYLSDTTQIAKNSAPVIHFPIRYDFDDFMGKRDWSKMFVSKLIETRSGQCHSMPLLYLILAHEVGAKANLAFGPNHIYIKFPDNRGHLRNLELTNGRMTSDAWIVASGYVKAEAVRHGIYFDTLSVRETIALCMFDLANGYSRKFGLDRFVLDAVNAGLEIHPNSVHGLMLKSDFYTNWFASAHAQAAKPSLADAKANHPGLISIYQQRNRLYDLIDATGFEVMPEKAYIRWLSSVNAAAQIRQDHTIRTELNNK